MPGFICITPFNPHILSGKFHDEEIGVQGGYVPWSHTQAQECSWDLNPDCNVALVQGTPEKCPISPTHILSLGTGTSFFQQTFLSERQEVTI